jgi:hypothetical protein
LRGEVEIHLEIRKRLLAGFTFTAGPR